MITGKDLDYISDLLDQNLVFLKKCMMYKNMLADQTIANEVQKIYNDHKNHYEKILGLLQ